MNIKLFLNKVPEITLYFWIIKILCTTVGETGADFLNTTLNLGLSGTTVVMSIILLITLFFQLVSQKYRPPVYWLVVVLLSVVGTLITDNLTSNFGFSLQVISGVFAIILAIVFATWYKFEGILSVHSIHTLRRELFYWLAILFTFALGTAVGDLLAEALSLGYLLSAFIFGGSIALVYCSYKYFKLNAVLAFWIAYILTRPLGASLGDYLSQAKADGGLGLGTVITSILFLITIIGTVVYLVITKKDSYDKELL